MSKKKLKPPVKNAVAPKVENSLGGALGLGVPGLDSFPTSNFGGAQIAQSDTLFKSLRYYLVSNFRQLLSQCYVEIGLIQTIVDVPVDDALRGGIEIKSGMLDEDEIKQLQVAIDRDNILRTVAQAAKWTRLFGGGALIILTDQDPLTPLDIEAITEDTPFELKAVDLWELYWAMNLDDGLEDRLEPEDLVYYNYYGKRIHKSRVMRDKGIEAPSFIRQRMRGWGVSVVETLVRSINQYLKATDLAFEVLDEFKVDVYKIKNLVNTLLSGAAGEAAIKKRIAVANQGKNYNNALVLDSEDEWDHKQLSFSGLAETMDGIRMQVAADMRMPITKLFGQSQSGGIGNTDQNDMENYNSMVESQVRSKIKYDLLRIVELKCQQLFGYIPDDMSITFKPLRVLSAIDEESVKTQKFNRLLQAKSAGEITRFEFREGVNKDDLLGVSLDTSGDELNPDDPDVEALNEGQAGDDEKAKEMAAQNPQMGPDGKPTKPIVPPKSAAPKGAPPAKLDKAPPIKNEGFEEGKHPRADDGKFGKGGGKSDGKKPRSKAEARRREQDEYSIPDSEVPDGYMKELSEEEVAIARARFRKPDDRPNPATESKDETATRQDKLEREMRERAAKKTKKKNTIKNELVKFGMRNSLAYDVASYVTDGGDAQVSPGRQTFFEVESANDVGLYREAEQAALDAFGKPKWQFVKWYYEKEGGTWK